jgi:phosphoribosylamine--glycine ligase
MGSISPHPLESDVLIRMAAEDLIRPFIQALKDKGILRPCVLYPGCIVSITSDSGGLVPTRIRMCEMNIRPGEPEFQPIALRLKNLGPLISAMLEERLHEVVPEVKTDQLSMTIALVVGSSNKRGEGKKRGYPWSHPVGEPIAIDFEWFKKNPGVRLIPSAMSWRQDVCFVTGGSRVAYLAANVGTKAGEKRGATAERLRQKLVAQITGDSARIKVVPEEDAQGNRLDFRADVGSDYGKIDLLQQEVKHAAPRL